MARELARTFSAVFAPEFFVLACTVLLAVHEWRASQRGPVALARPFGVEISRCCFRVPSAGRDPVGVDRS